MLREGLPSAVGEILLKSADYEIYVRDRSPQAHFAARAYVLPRQGQLGAPLTTVNTSKVSVDVYRVGDRNLLAPISRDDFLKPISSDRASEIEIAGRREGLERVDGHRLRAQQGRRHRFPARRRGRQAAARRLSDRRAALEGAEGADGNARQRRATTSSRRNGWSISDHRPDHDLRRRRRCTRWRARSRPPRRSPASRCG